MRREALKQITKQSIPALTVAALIHIVAGTTMQLRGVEAWFSIPVFFVLLPSLSELGNDAVCIISARLTTLLALGVIEPKLKWSEALERNVIAIVTVGVLSSLYMGIVNFAIAGFGSVHILSFLAVCVMAVVILTLLDSAVAIAIAFIVWRRGLDPDNVTIPISTSISDLLAIFALLVAMRTVGFL